MRRPLDLLFAGATAIALSAAAAAYAQPAPPAHHSETRIERDGDVTVVQDGKTVMVRHGHHRDMAQHLRDILQLRPGQEAALSAYVQAMEPKHEMMMRMAEAGPKTTPERLAMEEKMLAEHEAAMRARIEATRRFYDQLDPAQKKAFDELHAEGHMGLFHLAGLPMDMAFMAVPPMPPMPPSPPDPPTPPEPPGDL